MNRNRTAVVALGLLLASCAPKHWPVSPWDLEGFPGAEINAEGYFDLVDGRAWVFDDELDPGAKPVSVAIHRTSDGSFEMRGQDGDIIVRRIPRIEVHRREWLRQGVFEAFFSHEEIKVVDQPIYLAHEEGFLTVRSGDRLLSKPLKMTAKAGETWQWGGANAVYFGFDRIDVMGEERRVLVVALTRRGIRDIYYLAHGYGWVRARTEVQGKLKRDLRLVQFRASAPVD